MYIKKLNRKLKREGELVVCVERLVGGMGPTEVGGGSHFTVKFLLNTAAFSVSTTLSPTRRARQRFGNHVEVEADYF